MMKIWISTLSKRAP